MIERSKQIGQVVELLTASGYGTFVFDRATEGFRLYRDQPALNVFFLPAHARIRRE